MEQVSIITTITTIITNYYHYYYYYFMPLYVESNKRKFTNRERRGRMLLCAIKHRSIEKYAWYNGGNPRKYSVAVAERGV